MSLEPDFRDGRLGAVFVALADTLVHDFDVVELLHRLTAACVELLGGSAAGIMLADQRGALRVIASSTEQMRMLELFELQNEEGPCLECFHAGTPVEVTLLGDTAQRWPSFTPAAVERGFAAVQAMPLRLRDQTIGALNLFYTGEQQMGAHDQQIAQALADVATIGILQQRSIHRSEIVAEQLQSALNTRSVIEQAKGVVAENARVGIDLAFELLRAYARARRTRIDDVARAVVAGELTPAQLRAVSTTD